MLIPVAIRPGVALLYLALATVGASAQSPTEVAAERIGPPLGFPLAGEALEAATEELTSVMRCPVCQALSVADSPTDSARAMQLQVRNLLAAGFAPSQILEYFEKSYGEFIRLAPKPVGFNLLVWTAPVAAILAGAWLIAARLRRPRVEAAEPATRSAELEAYRDKVRREISS